MYAKNFLFLFGSTPRLAIFDPDMVKEILTKLDGSFEMISLNPLARPLFGQGLAGLSGQEWAIHRRIANQAFNCNLDLSFLCFEFVRYKNLQI